jgi:cytosine/adenosine deaminase-related metal-dependent hydrolase
MSSPTPSPLTHPAPADAVAPAAMLIRGGWLLTMGDAGDAGVGDVLIEHGVITAVGGDLSGAAPAGAEVVDARGLIVLPGFQDGHRHCWQGQFRRMFADHDILGYMVSCHDMLAPTYAERDMYVGGQLSAWAAIDAGITTVLDFTHNTRTLEFAVAAGQAFVDAGVRCVQAFGPPSKGEWDHRWPGTIGELAGRLDSPLLTVRLGPYGDPRLGQPTKTMSRELIDVAREHGLGTTVDAVFGPDAADRITELAASGHLGPDVALIHANNLHDEAWRAIADTGTGVVLAPTSDAWLGIEDATSPLARALEYGVRPSLSIDVECSLSSDMFTVMRTMLTVHRMLEHRRAWEAGETPPRAIPTRRILEMATADGAAVNGLPQTGRLEPGMQADLIAISAEDVNNMPLNDPVSSVVLGSDARNVRLVLVAGRVRKWGTELVGVDLAALRAEARESRDRLVRDSGIPERAPALPLPPA